MTDVTVYGFPISTFVNIVRLVLTHKKRRVRFSKSQTCHGEPEPSGAAPVQPDADSGSRGFPHLRDLRDRLYVDEAFAGRALHPKDLRERARMHQWISAMSSYSYMSFHLSHEQLIHPALGIAPDEKVVAHALPRITVALDEMERELNSLATN